MAGYKSFVKQNCDNLDSNGQNEKSKFNLEDKNVQLNDPTVKLEHINNINKNKETNENILKSKIKNIEIQDISLCDEESDVEILKIIDPQEKKKKSSNVKFETKEINKNININSTTLCNTEKNNVEVIHTVSGTWFVSSDNNNTSSKKKKIHKDVENTFKNIETELKNQINKKLVNINKKEVKIIPNKIINKRESKKIDHDSDYLKMNNKRTKAEFNEPLYENGKILDKMNPENVIDNQILDNKIVDKSSKQVQNIDPTEFLHVSQTNLESKEMPLIEDHLDDKENEQEKLIAEAFADDDIINEFK